MNTDEIENFLSTESPDFLCLQVHFQYDIVLYLT